MTAVRKDLEKMEDFEVACGPLEISEGEPRETVKVVWTEQNTCVNAG